MCRKIILESWLSAGLCSKVLNACAVTLCDDVLWVVGLVFLKFLCQITNPVAGWKLKISHISKKASGELMSPSLGCGAAFWGTGTAPPGLTTPPHAPQAPFNPPSSCFNLWPPSPLPTLSPLLCCFFLQLSRTAPSLMAMSWGTEGFSSSLLPN